MSSNAVVDYSIAVKYKFEEAKTGVFSSFILNPSPAELKNLGLLLFDKGLSRQDQEIMERFFDLNDNLSKRKQIECFNVDKLRPICNFLKNKTETTRIVNLDFIAVLVDFNPRPYKKYVNRVNDELTAEIEINAISKLEDIVGEIVYDKSLTKNIWKRLSLMAIPLFVIGSGAFGVKQYLYKEKECMVWVKNHYEAYDYNEVKDKSDVLPFNKVLLVDFKKLLVCDTTKFFRNGDCSKPIVWYGKSVDKKEYEYFSQPGLHPETGKTLKPITKYIIHKYIYNCK